jgi:uncharacterized protein with GYD domain
MPRSVFRLDYMIDGVCAVVSKGRSARRAVGQAAAERLGGTLESMHFPFGGTDVFATGDLPDHEAGAALALTVGSSGAASVEAVVLLPEEVDVAVQKVVQYTAPGQ